MASAITCHVRLQTQYDSPRRTPSCGSQSANISLDTASLTRYANSHDHRPKKEVPPGTTPGGTSTCHLTAGPHISVADVLGDPLHERPERLPVGADQVEQLGGVDDGLEAERVADGQ